MNSVESEILKEQHYKSVKLVLFKHFLTELPPQIQLLSHLKELHLTRNQIRDLPSWIGLLANLEVLILRGNKLKALPASIGKLKNLKKLDLSYCDLHSIPKELGLLHGLEYLNVRGNNLREIPKEILQLSNLKELNLHSNRMTEIYFEDAALENLSRLDASSNLLTSFSGSFGKCNSLHYLNLNSNQLAAFPSNIGELLELETIRIDNNNIQKIPDDLRKLNNLKHLEIDISKICYPPQNIVASGIQLTLRWLEQSHNEGVIASNSTKVMVLGPPEVGKTSLCLKLENINNDLPEYDERTVGVDITHLHLQEEGFDQERIAHLFDFAGQESQYFAHHFFMTPDAFHILVFDQHASIELLAYWINSIVNLNNSTPKILPILNFRDKMPRAVEVPQIDGAEFLPTICFDLLKSRKRILEGKLDEIRQVIETHIEATTQPILKKWYEIREYLAELNKNYITKETFREICGSSQFLLSDEQYQDDLLKFLHGTGYVAYFPEAEPNYIFLNPNWIIKAIYTLFNPMHPIHQEGYFSKQALIESWRQGNLTINQPAYSEKDSNMLFNLLLRERFNICYSCEHKGNDIYFLPYFLDNIPRKEGWQLALRKHDNRIDHRRHVGMRLIPVGFISQLIVIFHDRINLFNGINEHWESGFVLRLGTAYSLIETRSSVVYGNYVSIEVFGHARDKRMLKELINHKIEDYLQNSSLLFNCEYYEPCAGCLKGDKEGKKFSLHDESLVCELCGCSRNSILGPIKMTESKTIVHANTIQQLNTGKQENVTNTSLIQAESVLKQNEKEAFEEILKAIQSDQTLDDNTKNELKETVNVLQAEVAKPAEERNATSGILLRGLETSTKYSDSLHSIWSKWGPVITSAFG